MDPYVGEIRVVGFGFAPSGWAACNGATLAIQQFAGLYSLIGTVYGGNGTSSFQIPNLIDRAMGGVGTGTGLSQRDIGESYGVANVALLPQNLPPHNHPFPAFTGRGATRTPAPTNASSYGQAATSNDFNTTAPNATFAVAAMQLDGGNQPHANQQPNLAMQTCIALDGVFPSFS
jgi:microcystin-dependent protein